MPNNNETNENVSRVVADFFKSNPIQKRGGPHKNRSYPSREQKAGDKDRHRDKFEDSTSGASLGNAKADNQSGNQSERFDAQKRKGHNFKRERYTRDAYKDDQKKAIDADIATTSENKDLSDTDKNDITLTRDSLINENTDKSSDPNGENEWYDPNTPIEIIGVRFKSEGKVYYFAPMGTIASKNDNVIVETARGLEFGTVQIPNTTVLIKDVVMPLKNVVRLATKEDIEHHKENEEKVADALRICNERIAVHNLDMKLVEVEYTFDNSKLLFYFTSEGRVDFRELVKDLAGIFKTRIELRQIGIREETKRLGGIGICGLPFCCKTFLNDFVQVSIKMAKEQGLSLNSAKISGACGRLMCCLRYEYDTYDEEIRKTPKVDTPVITPDGPGVICETQPLAGLCKVRLTGSDEEIVKVYHRDDLKAAADKNFAKHEKQQPEKDSSESRT